MKYSLFVPRIITNILFLSCIFSFSTYALSIHIPDANLRQAVEKALELHPGADITKQAIATLRMLDAPKQGIKELAGLEHAESLEDLRLPFNEISDLTPLAPLKRLKRLYLYKTFASDLSPLGGLTQLEDLDLSGCEITDISPVSDLKNLVGLNLGINRIANVDAIANLTNLERLYIGGNLITDVRPLANLTNLDILSIGGNLIIDHSPLDGLNLSVLEYDQTCEIPPIPVIPRLKKRSYPSVFTASWVTHPTETTHDLYYGGSYNGLRMQQQKHGWALVGNLPYARQLHADITSANPNMIFLINIAMREEPIELLGEDWPYWVRDNGGQIIPGYRSDYGLINFTQPAVQDRIVQQAIAVSKCGLYDGIVFDLWHETIPVLANQDEAYIGFEGEQMARDNILQRTRAHTHPEFLIQVNSNRGKIPRTAPYINGLSMETGIPSWFLDDGIDSALRETEDTLLWAEQNLREPRINGVAGAAIYNEPFDSPQNRRWMRVIATLSLTHSDGYTLYQRSFGDWWNFWDADLGRPVGEKGQLHQATDGLYIREYTNGWAVYNHSGAEQTVTLPELASGVASGLEGMEHTLPNLDGEMYLRVKPPNPADVNGDGVVNLFDLTLVAQAIGTGGAQGDVNGDSVVNVFDLVFVANQF